MKRIETQATVSQDHCLTARVPEDIEPGVHRVTVILEDSLKPQSRNLGDFPSFPAKLVKEKTTFRRAEIYGDEGR